ncbi:MAG TPA: hypothetical protein VIM75_10475 [Ohtaekwangia sp.]|uniref:hypothetical protein n=1 Tax=Ohtaekwangia sp. TaxID=2066019 RepID=UPI002F92C7A8
MQQFTITEEGLKKLQKKILTSTIPFYLFLLLVIAILSGVLSGSGVNSSGLILLLIFVPIFTITIFINIKRQKAVLSSYRLTITEDSITREMHNTPSIVLLHKNIQEIVKNANGSFAIIADSKINAIGVPQYIERSEELEQLLVSIKPLKVKTSTPWYQKYPFVLPVTVIGLIGASFYSNNQYLQIVGIAGFVATLIFGFIVIQKSKNVDLRLKRMSYIALIPILSMLYALIVKLSEL